MRKIFRKNQIVISALALMIAVAGYLSITNDRNKKSEETSSDGILDISDEDLTLDTTYKVTDTGDIVPVESADVNTTAEPVAGPDVNAEVDGNADSTGQPKDNSDSADKTDLNAGTDADSQVAQNGTQETAKSVGEAVLVSNTIGSKYFDSARLQREQTRSKNKEILMELINSEVATDEQKEQAVAEVINLTSDSEKENAAESMLSAKGYGECIVNITDGSVDVIVGAEGLTDKDIAQIEDIVKRKTEVSASEIVITPVGVSE